MATLNSKAEEIDAIRAKDVIAFRVQRRKVWDSDESAHFNFVLQALVDRDGYNEWEDVPLVDEDGDRIKYR